MEQPPVSPLRLIVLKPEQQEPTPTELDAMRVHNIARQLAFCDGVIFDDAAKDVQAHYTAWAWTARRGSTCGPKQWAIAAVGLHAAAQAGHDNWADLERQIAVDLGQHTEELKHWHRIAGAIVRTYLAHLGRTLRVDQHNDRLWLQRIGLTEDGQAR